ncbi:hypothetical protein Vafri_18928 [Volvox africanus]|uniref:Protein VACUOLELESS1 n=1 Tax=Volvox africanus TaxID=51714 RepID=A0A8J4BQ95_9CHLO|nr:hypothetical protein Vafri_18928 [Volvox africanus]
MADLMAQLKTQAVGEWEMVGECFFTREPLYDMSWGDDFELEDKRLTCAPFGGPIAAIRDERRTVLVTHGSSAVAAGGGLKPLLRTFTSAGESLGACLWEGGRLVAWGWTEEQQLAIVEATGKVSLFSPFAEKIREFSFGAVVEKDGVAAAEVYGSGVVVVTEPRQPAAPPGAAAAAADVTPSECCEIWVVSNVRDPKPIRLKSPSKEAYRAAAAAAAAAAGTGARGSGPLPGVITGLGGLGRPWLPQCLAVLDPRVTLSRGVEVLAVVGGSLWQLDEASATDHYPLALRAAGSAVHLAVSPDGSFIALYTSDDRLLVLSADLNRQLTEFETRGADFAPTGLYWVGSDAVLLTWPDAAVLVGAFGDSVQWSFSEDLTAVIPEVDGCRLIMGRTAQQLLRKVPESCVEVFRPGATGPAAQLWDARTLYDDQNPRCDRILRSIQDLSPASLSAAVATCIQAAGHDLNPVRQRALMRAAAYGRPFCPPDFPRQLMYGVACRLRILNAARDPRVGLPLTMTQLEALSLPVLVARLISYRQWLLAYRVAEVLKNIPGGLAVAVGGGGGSGGGAATAAASAASGGGDGAATGPPMGQEQVLVQWACAKISAASAASGSPVDDEQLKDAIVAKLKCCPSVRYAPLAAHALAVGRRRLALRLLEEERSAAQQVPLLLSLAVGPWVSGGRSAAAATLRSSTTDAEEGGEGGREEVLQRALRKAVESGDTDLVYLVLFGMYRACSLPEFWHVVAQRPLARNLFIRYCKAKEPELLETILTAAAAAAAAFPPSAAAAELSGLQFRAALAAEEQQTDPAPAATKLASTLADVAQKYGQSKECAFQSKAVAEMGSLLREQVKLERETGQRLFVGLSLVDTLRTAIRLGHHKAATALKKQFSVTDRRLTWIKVRTLAEARDWESLEGFATELRRNPIGWEPFVEAAKKWNAPQDYTARLVARLPDSPSKAEEYSALGLAKDAAEVAARIKDSDLFARIQSAVAAGSPAAAAIAQIKDRFQSAFR